MLNDAILSGLINLFALLDADGGRDSKASEDLLGSYLTHHFGLRDKRSYMDLYRELSDFYRDIEVDKDQIIDSIASKLRPNMESGELTLILLRLMEFSSLSSDGFDKDNPIFHIIAERFGVSDSLYDDFCDFIAGKTSDAVKIQSFDKYDGVFKTLWIGETNTMLFSYLGDDELLFNDVRLMKGIFQIWHKSGVAKNHKGAPIYYSGILQGYNTEGQESICFSAVDINFRFPGSNNGIHNLNTELHSGELVAIMGGSGAGKTTLLSILNGSLRPQEGTIAINGHSIDEPEAKGLIGFVPQDDLLIEELTVYQNLYYTARFCFDGMPEDELDRRVMKTLSDLGLEAAKDIVVGSPRKKTTSGGQRKRLNIPLELIREPAVIFLDEPTSGVSSADTENVMGLLKDQTYKGKLVVANIHQPSSDVYKLFDRLLLLDLGGYPVFDGNPIDAVTYFKSAANYADAQASTCPVCGNVNPETVLNIISEKALDGTGKISQNRKVSPEQWHGMYLESRRNATVPSAGNLVETGQKSPSPFKQMLIYLERTFKAKLSNTQYILITLLEAPLLALICGFLTRYAPATGYTVMDNKNIVSYFFMAVIVAVFIGMSGSAEEIIRDRLLLKREKFLNLSYKAYIFSKIIFAAGVALLQTALFIVVGNLLMGLHGMFLMWWAILFVSSLLSSLIGLLLSQCMGSVVAIYITIPILLIPQILLCGLVVDFSDLNGNSTTDNVPVIGEVIPSRWAFEAVAVGTYCYNDYERPFFELDKERYQAFFFRESYIPELESQLEKMNFVGEKDAAAAEDCRLTIENSLPRLAAAAGMEPYAGDYSYESLEAWLGEAKSELRKISNDITLRKDAILSSLLKERGKEKMLALKKSNCNIRLEEFLTGSGAEKAVEVVKNHLVPRSGYVFLTPVSRNGRAPFYSSVKVVGGLEIPTLLYNMCVMLLMCVLLIVVLLLNLPERRKK
ncbi:MAG: ATP-binding cassette domain-containing protein [Bacteroidales bacterium]|nr:ATP-binding cassette domain-containing protein [Bacteroidales bacterium]